MAAIWDGFTGGIVDLFVSAAKKVTEIWRNTVNGITDFLLRKAAQGGVIGTIISKVLGVDVKAETAKTLLQKNAQVDVLNRALVGLKDELKQAQANGGAIQQDGQTFTIEDIEHGIADIEESLRQAEESTADPLAEMQENARAQTHGTADAVQAARQVQADGGRERRRIKE